MRIPPCADKNYLTELDKGDTDKGQFVSRLWEAMLYSRFNEADWSVSGGGNGPDFRIDMDASKGNVLVEAVAAQLGDADKNGMTREWQDRKRGEIFNNIYNDMIPRLTSVLKTKKDNHLKHIESHPEDKDTPFVIAVHDGMLGSAHGHHPCTNLLLIVHAVLPVGTPAVIENAETGEEIVGPHLQSRNAIPKRNGGTAPTGCFLDDDYKCVSAVIYCWGLYEVNDKDGAEDLRQPPYVVVHNPEAKNPLPQPWLPGATEYAAAEAADGTIEIKRLEQLQPASAAAIAASSAFASA